ncbi:MAG: hypothetical protein KF745_01835 [Phycisphaeraceae bacterium]|nr:hypothetical protein [Phycisphaeraceae bacterium]
MSVLGPGNSIVTQSVAGAPGAERIASRDAARRRQGPAESRRPQDEIDLEVSQTQTDSAVRNLASNDREEAREDRREHPAYGPPQQGEPPPNIDVQA